MPRSVLSGLGDAPAALGAALPVTLVERHEHVRRVVAVLVGLALDDDGVARLGIDRPGDELSKCDRVRAGPPAPPGRRSGTPRGIAVPGTAARGRLFAVVGIGSSLGAVVGAWFARMLFVVGLRGLMLAAAVIMLASLGLTALANRAFEKQAASAPARAPLGRAGGSAMLAKDRYMQLIAILVVVLNLVNTTGEYVPPRSALPPTTKIVTDVTGSESPPMHEISHQAEATPASPVISKPPRLTMSVLHPHASRRTAAFGVFGRSLSFLARLVSQRSSSPAQRRASGLLAVVGTVLIAACAGIAPPATAPVTGATASEELREYAQFVRDVHPAPWRFTTSTAFDVIVTERAGALGRSPAPTDLEVDRAFQTVLASLGDAHVAGHIGHPSA